MGLRTDRAWTILRALGMILLGGLGMGLYQASDTLYQDWRFLHQVRLQLEQQRASVPPAPVTAP